MNEFVLAEDFFNWLFTHDYANRNEWRNINLQTTKYTVPIFCKNCNLTNLHLFQVIVNNGEHLISRLSIKIFCSLHNLNFEEFLAELER